MIYLITGVPGSGKTLYAVSTLVQKLAEEKITDKQGNQLTRRVVVDGIPDLVFPHEMMAKHDEGVATEKRGEGDGLWNWFEWCKPGDVIVVDEVQRHWRPRGMGTKPPKEIAMLETHRHLGVDFVVITQNPMLIDQNVRRLIGRHQHIRRLFGMPRAVIYDWDGCSVDVHRTKSATTSYWSYPKSAYKLYKSAELHTKQKQKIPLWLVVPIAAIIGGAFVAPTAFATLTGAATGNGIPSATQKVEVKAPALDASIATPQAFQASAASSAPVQKETANQPNPFEEQTRTMTLPFEVAGCMMVADRCGCVDTEGRKIQVLPALCANHVKPVIAEVTKVPDTLETVSPLRPTRAEDVEVLAYLRSERQRGHRNPE